MKKLFITATDTDAGKTHVSRALITALVDQGFNVAAYKPISAGCEWLDGQLINEDASLLLQAANCQQTISEVNPIAFEEPIAPHIAAIKHQQSISLASVSASYQAIERHNPDVIVTEGAGGWRLPIGQGHYLSEFVQQTKQEVILIVNMKLGCLNHAVLTYESILNDGLSCAGWIANCQSDMPYLSENIEELTKLIDAPLLATIPQEKNIKKIAQLLMIEL